MQRLVWLDALKGVGILSIMRIHMLQPMELIQSIVYVGAVAMFFVSAGFNLNIAGNKNGLICRKAKRLLIPYLAYSILLLIIEHHPTWAQLLGILYGRMSLYKTSVPDNIPFLIIGNAPMWFLPCMFLSYIWIYAIYCRCNSYIYKICVLIIFFLLSFILSFSPIMLPWSFDTSFLLALLIIIGYKFKAYFLSVKKNILFFSTILWFILFVFFAGSNISVGYYGEYGILSILAFSVIALVETYSISGFMQLAEKTYLVKCLAYIGRQSLRLMCIHLIIYTKCISFLSSYFTDKIVLLLLIFIIILVLNAILDFFVKKCKVNIIANYL